MDSYFLISNQMTSHNTFHS